MEAEDLEELKTAQNESAQDENAEGMTDRQVRLYVVSSALLTLAVALCLVIASQVVTQGYASFFGRSVFRVVTGSMEPTIPVNSVLLCVKTDIGKIREGDIVCYRSREPSHQDMIITHRVMSVQLDGHGSVMLETRGDANVASDPYYVTRSNLIGKVKWYSGNNVFTSVLTFMSGKIGFLSFVVLPVLLVAGLVLQSVGRNIRNELKAVMAALRNQESGHPADDLIPGYQTITREDYEQIYESVKRALLEELNGSGKIADR